MKRLVFGLFVFLIPVWAMAGQDQEFHYHYIPLETPSGYSFVDTVAISDSGRIVATAYAKPCDIACHPGIVVYEHGQARLVRSEAMAYAANEFGTIGGSVVTAYDPDIGLVEQAAVFRGRDVELIPRLAGEVTSQVSGLTDTGQALVVSLDENGNPTRYLYKNGQVTPVTFSVPSAFGVRINNYKLMSGSTYISGLGYRGFRYDVLTGTTTLLDPLSTEPSSWATGINNHGEVVGYSFVSNALERIGIWDRFNKFHTYFVEGTPDYPEVSNNLLFNDNNLIVITYLLAPIFFHTSYLVPKPGVRLDLADLVENLPTGFHISLINAINNRGDMVGGNYLLARVCPRHQ